MFELKFALKGGDHFSRDEEVNAIEIELKEKFTRVQDVSQWKHSPGDRYYCVSIMYQARKPQELKRFISRKGYRVLSLENLNTNKFVPINRQGVRRRPMHQTRN